MRILWKIGLTAGSLLGLATVVLSPALTGCGGNNAGESSAPKEIVVDGSSTVFRISSATQEAYSKVNRDVTVIVDNHGTGGGFNRYLKGEVDIVDASRPAKDDEEAEAKKNGLDWTRFLVGYDGITLVVNPKNDFVKSLTVEQLKKIWEPDSKVKTWKDVDPSWPDREIELYCPDKDSGTFDFFTEAIVGKVKSQRGDVQASSDDNILVKGVAGDEDGLGYFGFAYFVANKDKLRAVAVQNGPDAKPVLPTHETILNKSYAPLARSLYLYVKNSSLKRPEVYAFVKFYLDEVATLAEKAGYVAPHDDDKAANQKALPASPSATATTAK
jgi:phosphate transport system substrate-binding protein